MADNKKEQERAELHRTIWNIANDLRGSVDGWDFKQYVLGMLFYRYISENLTAYINDGEYAAGDKAFNYAALADKAMLACKNSGFDVGDHFVDVNKMIEIGSGAQKNVIDYKLTRYA